jgi:hypothetical protein
MGLLGLQKSCTFAVVKMSNLISGDYGKTLNNNIIMDSLEPIKRKIYEIRGQRVMLDFDLAELYCVETRSLNQAVKRNIERFPDDFMFRLTAVEWGTISSQFVMTSRAKRPKSALPMALT